MRSLTLGALGALWIVGCTQLLGLSSPEPTADAGSSLLSCPAGRESCGGALCDTDTRTSRDHCGACNQPCAATNGTADCVDGKCRLACAAGFADCNASTADGCETSLTSHDACGRCGRNCGPGACVAGVCTPYQLFGSVIYAQGLAVDATSVYFTDAYGTVRKAARDGTGLPSVLVSTDVAVSTTLAFVDPTLIVRSLKPQTGAVEVRAASRNGKSFNCLATNVNPRDLAADPSGVLWTEDRVGDAGILRSVGLDAGCTTAPTELLAHTFRRADRVYLDGDDVYFTAFSDVNIASGAIMKLNRTTQALSTLISKTRPSLLSADQTHVYFVYSDSSVARFPKKGCPDTNACIETLYFEEFGRIVRLFVDDRQIIYVAVGSGTSVVVLDKSDLTKPPDRVSVENAAVAQLVVDHDTIFFSANNIYGLSR